MQFENKDVMNKFDLGILRYLNQFARHSQLFDTAVDGLASMNLLKGGVMIAFFWWVWFRPGTANDRNRQIVVATLLSAVLAVVVGRLLADYLPFRLRPLQAHELGLISPYGVTPDTLRTWSSFPSDHAMVFTAMSTGLWCVSRRLGAVAGAYVLLAIALPRIYLGFHYPTDILAGAFVGFLFAYLANLEAVRARLAAPAMRWLAVHPASFYTFAFFFSQALATLFDAERHLAVSVYSLIA
jgi:undecaprenyl-diphosphatase